MKTREKESSFWAHTFIESSWNHHLWHFPLFFYLIQPFSDYLTIAPKLLAELQKLEGPVEEKLSADKAKSASPKLEKVSYVDDQPAFLFELANDPMANTKLAEGISAFAKDGQALKDILQKAL